MSTRKPEGRGRHPLRRPLRGTLGHLVELYAKGEITSLIRSTYPLDRAADAHRELGTGHGRGKIVITMS